MHKSATTRRVNMKCLPVPCHQFLIYSTFVLVSICIDIEVEFLYLSCHSIFLILLGYTTMANSGDELHLYSLNTSRPAVAEKEPIIWHCLENPFSMLTRPFQSWKFRQFACSQYVLNVFTRWHQRWRV